MYSRFALSLALAVLSASAVRAEDEVLKLDLAAMPETLRVKCRAAAPGVSWTDAVRTIRTSLVDGREVKEKIGVLTGTDAKGRQVDLTIAGGEVEEVAVVLELNDLPDAISRVFFARFRYGMPIRITAEGNALTKPRRYVFLYDGLGTMIVSADGMQIDTFNLDQ
jgi:hypothetical protein